MTGEYFWDPGEANPKQKLFFASRKLYTAYGGAKGGGKTWAVRTKALLGAYYYPGIRILIMRRTYPELLNNHIEPMRQALRPAFAKYSAERRGLEFIFPKNQVFNEKSIGGVPLSPTQIKMLSEGHTILVEDMKFKNRDGAFSAFVTIDQTTGRPNYTRHNPETGEIYIPKEICSVQLTPEDKETLRKGQAVYLENMINRKGEEFSAFVKLDMNTGRTMYSRTPDGFNEQQAPRIPAEVYGHVFTAQEKANLQDGKTLLVEGLKNNGQTFSSYLKVNPYSGQLQYFQENPDIRRDTSRQATQADTAQGQQQEQKKGAKQAV